MRRISRTGLLCALPIVALLVPQTAYATTGQPGPAKPASAAPAGTRSVSYGGVRVSVPATWPVIDLRLHPDACVRLDRSALYLGSPGAQSNCPAHAVGRADTIWLKPPSAGQLDQRSTPTTSRVATVGTLPARVDVDQVSHGKRAQFVKAAVVLDATWGANSSTVDKVLASAVGSPAPATLAAPAAKTPAASAATGVAAAAATTPAAAGALTAAPEAVASAALAPASVGGAAFTGKAFDTCAAPSASTMRSWLASPYRGVGVYIGGSMRACGDGNLSAAWVSAVHAMGWRLIPTYVGPQAPCVNQSGLAAISSSAASAQGVANADDAVKQAGRFGMGPGTPLYYDMEGYNPSASCSGTVVTFLSAWTNELHRLGYKSGAYGSPGSLMTDLSHKVGAAGFHAPDNVWFAHWNGLANTSDQASYPSFVDAYWKHQRVHQYSGNLYQSWGGVTVSIDVNWVDGTVAGTAAVARSTSADIAVVKALYSDLLLRPADSSGLATWSSFLAHNGRNTMALVTSLTVSREYVGLRVGQAYSKVLGRAANPGEMTTWSNAILRGALSVDAVRPPLYASAEFATRTGGTSAGYVAGLYQSILGRAAFPAEIPQWVARVNLYGRGWVADQIWVSQEANANRVKAYYLRFLKRAVDPVGLAHWTKLLSTQGEGAVRTGLAASGEYARMALKRYP